SAPHCQIIPALALVASMTSFAVYASGPGQYHTMCAIGAYEKVNHSTMNSSTALNFMRSANAPTIRQQVIAANVAWNATNTSSGIATPLLNVAPAVNSAFTGSNRPFMNTRLKPPKNWLPSLNARL